MSFAARHLAKGLQRKIVAAPAQNVPRRFMSGGSDKAHDLEETMKWRNVTAVAYVACVGFGIYTFLSGEHHHHENPEYSYLHIRNKEFPWGPCGLFEWDCQKGEKAH